MLLHRRYPPIQLLPRHVFQSMTSLVTHNPVVTKLTEPFEVGLFGDVLGDQGRQHVSGVDILHNQGAQRHAVLLGQFPSHQGDDVIDLLVVLLQVRLQVLRQSGAEGYVFKRLISKTLSIHFWMARSIYHSLTAGPGLRQ